MFPNVVNGLSIKHANGWEIRGQEIMKFEIRNSRHFDIYKNLNNSRTVRPIITKFGRELRLDTVQTPEVSETPFFKI